MCEFKKLIVQPSLSIFSCYGFPLLFNLERLSPPGYPCFLFILLLDFHFFFNIFILNIFEQIAQLKASYSKYLEQRQLGSTVNTVLYLLYAGLPSIYLFIDLLITLIFSVLQSKLQITCVPSKHFGMHIINWSSTFVCSFFFWYKILPPMKHTILKCAFTEFWQMHMPV